MTVTVATIKKDLIAAYGKTTLTLKEVCKEMGISVHTARNRRVRKTFEIPMTGIPLVASIDDVALYLYNRTITARKTHNA